MTVNELLLRIIDLLPSLVRALDGVARWAGAVAGFGTRLLSALQTLLVVFLAQRVPQPFGLVGPGGTQPRSLFQQFLQWFAQTNVGQIAAGIIARHYAVAMAGARAVGATVRGVGGVAGAVASGVAALASNPVTAVALAAVGLAVAFVGLGVSAQSLARGLLESQRHLANFSGAMAMVFAQSDVRRTLREMKAGNDQAGTAGFLQRGLDHLADTLQPILSLLANIGNVLAGVFVRLVDVVLMPLSLIVQTLDNIWEWAKSIWPFGTKDGDPLILSQWLDRVADQSRRDRTANGPFKGLKFS